MNTANRRERRPIPTIDELLEDLTDTKKFQVFQNAIQNALHGLDGVRNIADDIILWGRTEQERKERLHALFARQHERGLTVNPSKCLFAQDSLWSYGYTLTKDGLKADQAKVAAIQQFSTPENIGQLRSFLGLATYCSRFLRDFATITQPLRGLTKQGAPWS